jgi:DNA gyrase subunit B
MSPETKEYTGENIEVLKDLEHVRKRPAMYIGTTGPEGVHHLIWELIDNAVDEAGQGHGDEIRVTLQENNWIEVQDQGRGIPIDEHESGVCSLQVVMTQLHAGGKFDEEAYQTSGGLHGVGASVVNALASECEVKVRRDDTIARQSYTQGEPDGEVEFEEKSLRKTGTTIRFRPDDEIFPDVRIDRKMIAERMRDLSYLLPEVTFVLRDETDDEFEGKEFHSEEGLPEYIDHLLEEKEQMWDESFHMDTQVDETHIEIAFNFDEDGHSEKVVGYANNIKTTGGGTHIQGFKTALTRAVKEVSDKNNFKGVDLREGLAAVVTVDVPEPQFEGQTKGKLGNPEVRNQISSAAYDAIYKFLSKSPDETEGLVKKAQGAAKARKAAKQARDVARDANKDVSMTLSSKLSDCTSNDTSETELFLVEGDSAGGSAKQARDRHFQAILPLKGKIKNVQKSSASTYLKNDEIKAIITAVGTGINEDFEPRDLRYDKIIIMCDPDVDGLHIQTLLLTLFYNCMPELIKEGNLYLAEPPLYYRKKKNETEYLYGDRDEFDDGDIRRFKGLGEMNPDELWNTTMDPETRRLSRVVISDDEDVDQDKADEETAEMIDVCMGRKVSPRRELIKEKAHEVWDRIVEEA